MIRVVLDTNILVSALLESRGPSAQIFVAALDGAIRMCVTGNIYAEYEEVISRPRFKREKDIIDRTLQAIRDKGLWVRPNKTVRICSDPDDDMFLECAEAAGADFLVTGNLKDFPATWGSTRIVAPRWLFDIVLGEKPEGER